MNVSYQFLCICLPFIVTPYISRIFGAEGIGVFSYNMTVASYFGLFVILGLNNYGNREIAMNKEEINRLSSLFVNIYIMQVLAGILVLSVYGWYCVSIAKTTVSCVFGVYLLSYLFDINWFFFGMEEFKITVIRNTVIKLCTTVLILTFIREKDDLIIYVWITVVSYLLTQLSIWPFLKGRIRLVKPSWKEIKRHIAPNFILFIPVLGVSLYNMMDKVMIGLISSSVEVGYYESADKLKAIPIMFVTALGTVALPRISYLNSKSKESEMERVFSNSVTLINFVMTSICFGIMAVCSEFVPVFFGEGFEKSIDVLYFLLPSCFFVGIGNVMKTQFLIPKKRDGIYIQSIFIGAGLNLVINAVMIPRLGAVGAAIATLFTEIVVCGYQVIRISSDVQVMKYVMKDGYMYVIGMIMFLAVKGIHLPIALELLNVMTKIFIGGVVYVALLAVIQQAKGRKGIGK